MSSLAEEDDSGIALVVSAHRALAKLSPAHDLLKFIQVTGDRSFTATDEFNKRYLRKPDSDSYESVMLARLATTGEYDNDLRTAVKAELEARLKKDGLLEIARVYL